MKASSSERRDNTYTGYKYDDISESMLHTYVTNSVITLTFFMKISLQPKGWVYIVGESLFGLNIIFLDVSQITLLERPFVNESARFFSTFTKSRITIYPLGF